jgi:hypothetical protein
MAKYYLAHNAGREIAGEHFEVTSVTAGTAVGVFAAYKEDQIAKLDKLVQDGKWAVFEIDVAEYDAELKKKAPHLSSFPRSTQGQAPTSLKEPVAVVVDGHPAIEDADAAQLETLENALSSTAKIEPPPSLGTPQPRRSQRGK